MVQSIPLMTVKVKGGQQQDYHFGKTFLPSHRAGSPKWGYQELIM
jgi:hypothetical protein